jgi:hypothetical protein
MRRQTWIAIAALLAAFPAPGQIVQRMERDVAAVEKLQQTLEKAPPLGLADLKNIAFIWPLPARFAFRGKRYSAADGAAAKSRRLCYGA